jgi:hypothetical protein
VSKESQIRREYLPYIWENPPVSRESNNEEKSNVEEQEFVTLRIPKKQYQEWTELVDTRPWKKGIEEAWPQDSHIRQIARTEKDFVRRWEWQFISKIYLLLMISEFLELDRASRKQDTKKDAI